MALYMVQIHTFSNTRLYEVYSCEYATMHLVSDPGDCYQKSSSGDEIVFHSSLPLVGEGQGRDLTAHAGLA
jgi:hypothetical protein